MATITQTGEVCSNLYLGETGNSGNIQVTSGGLTSQKENIGRGTFTQTDGINSVTHTLDVGSRSGYTGTYNLSGTGLLSAGSEDIGSSGTGTFNQTGGTNSISNDLSIDSHGIYNLSGMGQLSAGTEDISGGKFNQIAGTNSAEYISIYTNGQYKLNGGTLHINGGLDNGGEFDLGNSTAIINASDNSIVNLALVGSELTNTQFASFSIGANSLLIVPTGFDPNSSFAFYSNAGILHHAGSTLEISSTQTINGSGTIDDHVVCQGTLNSERYIVLNGGLNISDMGSVYLSYGSLIVNDAISGMSGGLLNSYAQYIGYTNSGTFTQTGGSNSGIELYLGYGSGCSGTYNLSNNGQLSFLREFIGNYGTGVFNQTGGTNTMASSYGYDGFLCLGCYPGFPGIYNLSGSGQLSADYESIGVYGTGTFNQTGGTNSISATLTLGSRSLVNGTYNLSGTGALNVSTDEFIGYSGTGTFTHTGGTNSISNGYLYLGYNSGSSGTYELSDTGQLTAKYENIGYSGTGIFNQTGGTNSISSSLTLGVNSLVNGTYNLSGTGLLNVSTDEFVGYSGTGIFTQSGGTNSISSGFLNLGYNTGSSGTYELSDTGQLTAKDENIGYSGTGIFNQTGGTNSVLVNLYLGYNSGSTGIYNLSGTGLLKEVLLSSPFPKVMPVEFIGLYGTGTFTQTGGTNSTPMLRLGLYSGSSGTYNLNGGTLILQWLSKGSGAAAFNFGGGTLQASGALTTSLPMTLTGTGGNANIDTAGYSVTISGVLSGTGGLNKLNSGILTLSAPNSYSGNTTVQGGTLEITAGIDAIGTSLIDVQSGTAVLKTVAVNKTNLNISTAALATFEVVNGAHVLGAITGSGITTVDAGASLTAASINQGTLTLGIGARVTIQPIPGGPQGGAINPVPEPSAFVLLAAAFMAALYGWARKRKTP